MNNQVVAAGWAGFGPALGNHVLASAPGSVIRGPVWVEEAWLTAHRARIVRATGAPTRPANGGGVELDTTGLPDLPVGLYGALGLEEAANNGWPFHDANGALAGFVNPGWMQLWGQNALTAPKAADTGRIICNGC